MTVPMMVLAVGSALLGGLLGPTGAITGWLDPIVGVAEGEPVISSTLLMIITFVLIAVGVTLAYLRYVREAVPEVAPRGSVLTRAARRDLYQDDVNEAILMRPGIHLTRALVYADGKGIDTGALGIGGLIRGLSASTRKIQNGFVRSYALTMLAGVVVILGAVMAVK
jgi:NADH-quinone oxidoreductase subunit L